MTFLVKRPRSTGDIVTIKLQTAEELIVRVEKEDDNTITVSRPMTLSYSAQGVGMTAWIMTADPANFVDIDKTKIMAITPTMKQSADQYVAGTTGTKPVGRN